MGRSLVSDEMLSAFTVIGEYDDVAGTFLERYGGLVDEMSLSVTTEAPPEEIELQKIIHQLQEQN